MKVFDFFAVTVRGDCEGKTRRDVSYFSTEAVAETFSRGIDWYGDDGVVEPRQLLVFDDVNEARVDGRG